MYDELVKELRDSAEWADRLALLMGRSEGDTHAPIMRKAADALEQMHEREKFHAFVWKTLGFANMRQLEEMYHQFDEEDANG